MTDKNKFTYKIEERLVVLNRDGKGWTKELNRISFNGKPACYDIRVFNPDGKIGKGITLDAAAFAELVAYIKQNF